jgi:ubiquinone/menaquinone biosynthesis C-methylase UbiE
MKVKEYFDALAPDLDTLAWDADTAPWAAWAWRVIRDEVGPADGSLIVDLGAGTGKTLLGLTRFARGARFVGVDFSAEMIRCARSKDYGGAAIDFRVCRIDRLRLPPSSVDVFVSAGTFHHIKNKRVVLTQLAAMLRPGGKFINADIFKPVARYRREHEWLRQTHPEAAAEHDRVLRQFQWIYDRDRSHPREFHTDPYEFRHMLEDAGLGPARVYVSLHPTYTVVVGCKWAHPTSRVGRGRRRRQGVAP